MYSDHNRRGRSVKPKNQHALEQLIGLVRDGMLRTSLEVSVNPQDRLRVTLEIPQSRDVGLYEQSWERNSLGSQPKKGCSLTQRLDSLSQKINYAEEIVRMPHKTPLSHYSNLKESVIYETGAKSGTNIYSLKTLQSSSVEASRATALETKRVLPYYINTVCENVDFPDSQAMLHLQQSLQIVRGRPCLKQPSLTAIEAKKLYLPPCRSVSGKTLVLDLDETLIHCQEMAFDQNYDQKLTIKVGRQAIPVFIYIRWYAVTFLKNMAKLYEIVIFTGSDQAYADEILNCLDPDRTIFSYRLYRQHCIELQQGVLTKDLRILNRDLSSVVLVDDILSSFVFQLDNGIPILPFTEGRDNQLLELQGYLKKLAYISDVRQVNRSQFKFHEYHHYDQARKIVKALYQ